MPATYCATEIDRNHTPIISPTTRAIESLVIMLSPTGEMPNSARLWIRESPASHHSQTLNSGPANAVPQTRKRTPEHPTLHTIAHLIGITRYSWGATDRPHK